MRAALTLGVFTATIALVVARPRRWSEAWWTALGAGAMLALGLVSPRQALDAVVAGKGALLFLLSLLTLSLLIGKSGFFEWAAILCARAARGDARALYRNAFVAGAVVTAALSLDTTAVMLTPVVLALARRLKLPAAPYVILCAYVANVGSLALPISNLTNMLFAGAFHVTFAAYAARAIAPQAAALAVAYAALRWAFRRELPPRFAGEALPAPSSVVPDRAYFAACVVVLAAVLAGYFVAPLAGVEPYVFAFAGSGALAIAGAATGRVGARAAGELSWGLFPFVVGLFVCVRGLENLGFVAGAAARLARTGPGSPGGLCAVAGATAVAANVMNNLPAALLARGALLASRARPDTLVAALAGADVGPLVTPFGSLATMLVLALARRDGEEVPTRRFVALGAWAAPAILAAAVAALVATSG